MKDVSHIEKMIEDCKNENNPIEYQEKKNLLGLVNANDYFRACQNLGIERFTE